eukprot:tig00000342_g24199.t1
MYGYSVLSVCSGLQRCCAPLRRFGSSSYAAPASTCAACTHAGRRSLVTVRRRARRPRHLALVAGEATRACFQTSPPRRDQARAEAPLPSSAATAAAETTVEETTVAGTTVAGTTVAGTTVAGTTVVTGGSRRAATSIGGGHGKPVKATGGSP